MPAFTVSAQDSISITLSIPFVPPGFDHFQIWASARPAEADIRKRMKRADTETPFLNVDDSGSARHTVTFEELGTQNAKKIYVRTLGVRVDGTRESLESLSSVEVTRSNSVNEEVVETLTEYPDVPQVPFGFHATWVRLIHRAGQKIFFSYDGKADHGEVSSGAEAEFKQEAGGARRYTLAHRIFLRAAASAGGTVLVQAKRHDSEQL